MNNEQYLIDYLLKERNQTIDKSNYNFDLYRALVNIREPKGINEQYLQIEDQYLTQIIKEKGIVEINDSKTITIWQGDITRLKVGAIVNAANNQMLGCFVPGHSCIDNAIHTFAGVRLRLACNEFMNKQGHLEKTGGVKVTKAYNLPSEYVFHTVGPIVNGRLENKHKVLLKQCYLSCLKKADELNIQSIAFCCISTGVFHFPNEEAAKIAIETVKDYQKNSNIKVIFNVFKDEDKYIYEKLLKDRL
jgi:O-acetyl-ADP-ribose deacetylase (regulator of RNase III)